VLLQGIVSMKPWLRRSLWGLGAVVLLFAAVATWFVATFDANKYKGVAIDWMKTHRHRTLAIDGPIQLSVFPRLGVKVSKLSLSEVNRTDVFVAVDDAALAVDLLPLLRGDVVIGRIDAKGVRLDFQRDAKGRSNIDDLLASEPEQPQEAKKAMRLDISGIALADVKATLKDAAHGIDGTVLLRSLKAGRIANRVEAPVTLDARFDFKQPALKGDLKGDTQLTLDTDTQSIALRGTDLGFKGDAPGAAAIDAQLKGDVAWDGTKSSAEAKNLALKIASAHAAGLKLAQSSLEVERFAFDPARKQLSLRKLQARLKGTQGNQPLAFDLDWPELAVNGDTLSGSAFSGKLSRGGEMPLEASFKSAAPTGRFEAVRLPGVEAQVASHGPLRTIDGSLRSDLTLKPSPFVLSFDKLELQAKVAEPKMPPLALAVRGSAVASSQRSTWNLAGQLNQNSFASEGSAVIAGDVPQVVAKARFDALDLNRLLGPASAASAPAAGSASADTPVDLGALRSVNGQFSLRAGSFAFRQYRIGDAAIDATLDGGMLHVTTLHGKAWGGQVDASAFADARASRVAMKGTAAGVNVNALVKDVAAKDWIEGTGRVTVDLDSAGRSVNELRSRLKGSAALQVRDGAIKGINLAKSLRQAKAALSMKQDATQKASQTEKTDFSELTATFQIADGVARNHDLDMKSPFLRLGGEGAIDIGRGRIDYVARATVTATAKGQDAADLAALKGVTVPVRLTGPFESLDWKIEWSSVAAGVVTKQLEQQIGEKLGLKGPAGASSPSTADALKKTLKGLFNK